MNFQDMLSAHLQKMAEIQQDSVNFAKRVAEHHAEVIERNLKPEMQIAAKVNEKPEEKPVA